MHIHLKYAEFHLCGACRSVVAKVIGKPERENWKECAGTDEEEKAECAAFKEAFAEFNPES